MRRRLVLAVVLLACALVGAPGALRRVVRPLLLRVRRGDEQQQGARDLQRHRRGDRPRDAAATTSRCTSTARDGRADDQPDRHGRRPATCSSSRSRAPAPRSSPSGRPDERRRLVQRRRRGRAAQGDDDPRRDRPDRLRPRHRVGDRAARARPTTRCAARRAIDGGRPERRRRLRPVGRVGRLRHRHVRRPRRRTRRPLRADAAPTVASTTPANDAANVSGRAPTSPSPSASRSPCRQLQLLDLVYDERRARIRAVRLVGHAYTLDPTTTSRVGETCTVTVDDQGVTDSDTNDPPDTMAADRVFSFTTTPLRARIYELQGASHVSPLAGQIVSASRASSRPSARTASTMQDATGDGERRHLGRDPRVRAPASADRSRSDRPSR